MDVKNTVMDKVYATRLANLRVLVAGHDGPAKLAAVLAVTNAWLNALCGPTPTRNISESTARKFEQKLGLMSGWLDMTR